jgi:hypothetical protein
VNQKQKNSRDALTSPQSLNPMSNCENDPQIEGTKPCIPPLIEQWCGVAGEMADSLKSLLSAAIFSTLQSDTQLKSNYYHISTMSQYKLCSDLLSQIASIPLFFLRYPEEMRELNLNSNHVKNVLEQSLTASTSLIDRISQFIASEQMTNNIKTVLSIQCANILLNGLNDHLKVR